MSVIPASLSFLLVLCTAADAFMPLYDQNFGLGLYPSDFLRPIFTPLSTGYCRPWNQQSDDRTGISKIVNDKDTFKVYLDVQHFKPDEIKVKVIDDYVQIEGKHEERKDEHGFISREFVRRYSLPEGAEPEAVISELTSDGVLIVSAPKKALPESLNERIVPITQTYTPVAEQRKSGDVKREGEKTEDVKTEDNKSEKQKTVESEKILIT